MPVTPTKAALPPVGAEYNGGRVEFVVPLADDGAGGLALPSGGGSVAGPLTDRSGSITEGGTAQQIAAANAARRYFFICNTSVEILYVNVGATATSANSYPLAAAASAGAPGGSLVFEGSFIPSGSVSILGATTGSTFVAKEG